MSEGLEIAWVKLSELKGNPKNPKDHDVEKIMVSIETYGYINPIIVNKSDNYILAGHGRKLALMMMKGKDLPPPNPVKEEDGDWLVQILSGVEIENEKDALAFVIADNRLVELGGWNRAELLEAIEKIEHEFDVEEIGFQDKEVDLLIEDVEGTVSIEDIIDEKALQENNIYFDIMFEEEYHQELFYKFLDVLRDTEEGFTISERLYNHINKVI